MDDRATGELMMKGAQDLLHASRLPIGGHQGDPVGRVHEDRGLDLVTHADTVPITVGANASSRFASMCAQAIGSSEKRPYNASVFSSFRTSRSLIQLPAQWVRPV